MARAMAFPRQFPEASFKQALDYVAGRNMDKMSAIEGTYDTIGFLLYSVFGGPAVVGASNAGIPSERAIVKEMDRILSDYRTKNAAPPQSDEDEPVVQAGLASLNVPPWLLAFLIQLLQKLVTT